MSVTADYVPTDLPSVPTRYTEPRAHELRDRYLATYGGDQIPVPVESIAEDLLGLRIEEEDLGECSGMLIPVERLIRVNAAEAMSGVYPKEFRQRFRKLEKNASPQALELRTALRKLGRGSE